MEARSVPASFQLPKAKLHDVGRMKGKCGLTWLADVDVAEKDVGRNCSESLDCMRILVAAVVRLLKLSSRALHTDLRPVDDGHHVVEFRSGVMEDLLMVNCLNR